MNGVADSSLAKHKNIENNRKRMKQTITLVIGLVLAGGVLTVGAQPGQGRGAGAQHRRGAQQFPPPIAVTFDIDLDGVLSAAEIQQAPSRLLKLDQNGNGQLEQQELCSGGGGPGGQTCMWGGQGIGRRANGNGQNAVLLALFDSNKDGLLDSAEINGASAVLKALDKNNDGQVTAAEIRPLPGRGQGRPWAQK